MDGGGGVTPSLTPPFAEGAFAKHVRIANVVVVLVTACVQKMVSEVIASMSYIKMRGSTFVILQGLD